MALRIVNNLAAMNTQRWLGVADAGMKKSLERLSSGYRINKAADDAAGLAISQSFRANIASFKVASRNTSEAAALLQVAEGGMDQIGNMLTRLKELATQAASANVGTTERTKIDAEGNALLSEIDRIANSSKYGSTSLLDGTFGASQTGSLGLSTAAVSGGGVVDDANDNIAYLLTLTGNTIDPGTVVAGVAASVAEAQYIIANTAATADIISITNSAGTITETYSGTLTASSLVFANLGITITFSATISTAIGFSADAVGSAAWGTQGTILNIERTGLTSLNVNNAATGTYTISDGTGTGITIKNEDESVIKTVDWVAADATIDFSELGISFKLSTDFSYSTSDLNNMSITVSANTSSAGNTFQIGAENNSDNQISIAVAGTRKADLGLTDLDLATSANAQAALDLIDTAISSLAGSRGDIGASMNRLTYASANLATTIENVQAAESIIRDVDMAMEMTDFTKNQILLQAGTAMLAQANMAPQQVLALFG